MDTGVSIRLQAAFLVNNDVDDNCYNYNNNNYYYYDDDICYIH